MGHTNRLAGETSPYLLQHSHNPVDWYPWGDEALQVARSQDKPILVSIGYSACHWCHVMEKESFEDEETARFMNEHFVNIKVDREERPDIDHIYMDAVQAMTGGGGWPLNVFLTPDTKPFYGGTYFPPRPVYNRSSWKDVLAGVAGAFRDRRTEVDQHADNLTRHVATSGSFGIGDADAKANESLFQKATLQQIKDQLMTSADRKSGGFGQAPKFPQTFSIRYLLYEYSATGDAAALDQACLSLDSMIRGGIYDQLGGGFARYSTDDQWLVPHFEKMLYDNALLVTTLSEAFQLTHKPLYREAIEQTIGFVERELSNDEGAFFAALDADSEGVEGKYYVWDEEEIDAILGEDAGLFKTAYGVTAAGNWEGKNILTRPSDTPLSSQQRQRLESARLRLLEHRRGRIPPGLDNKVLLGWNALMNIALSKAYAALGTARYRDMAVSNMKFLQDHLLAEDGHSWFHARKGTTPDPGATNIPGTAYTTGIPGFLDDYACLIAALLQLQEITGDTGYLQQANETLRHVIDHFGDADTGFFFYTHTGQQDILLRKKEIYDGATPSGNSTMASNLLYLSIIFDQPEWTRRATKMASALGRVVTAYPGSFGGWATIFQALTYSISEVVITGRKPENARKEFLTHLVPFRVFQSAQEENTQFPLLRDKPVQSGPLIFLCKQYACQSPVNEVNTAIRLIENVHKFQG